MAQRKRVASASGRRRRAGARPAPSTPVARRAPDARWAVLPALLAALVYLNALHSPFVYDDARTVVGNPSLQDLHNWRWVLLYSPFRPLVNVSYALDTALWGRQPFGFHITSLLLHALDAVLLFTLVRALVADRAARQGERGVADRLVPIATATIFAVHPLLSEAVGYASARPELLCSACLLGALLLARRAVLGQRLLWAPAALCWALALASRETGAVAPLLLLLWDRLLGPRDDGRARRLWRLHLPLFALVVVGGVGRVVVYLRQEAGALPRALWQHVCTELPIFWRYLRLLLWPAGQSLVHPAQRVTSPLDWRVLLAAAAILAVAVACWLLRRRFPLIVLGIVWFPLLLAPSSLVVPLVELMAEHRAYLASAGIFLAVACGLGELAQWWAAAGRSPALLPQLLVVAIVGVLALLTLRRNEIWQDPVTLWGDAARKAPLTWAPNYALGDALRQRGDCAHAIPVYKRAVALLPGDTKARLNLGGCLAQVGRLEDARTEIAAVLAIDPSSAAAHNNLGMIAISAHEPNEALVEFQRALTLDPVNVQAMLNLAILYESVLHEPQVALRFCERAERLRPGTPGVRECIERNSSQAQMGPSR